ncbi:MAG: CoA transferase [Desulfobacteraceae bacterium]|nr:CoA transferase [Desulfobacteraceae bacterium]
MAANALEHLTIVELSNTIAGSMGCKILADFGARVIKIESPLKGDNLRDCGPFLNDQPDPDLSGPFLFYNTNKLGITLDITILEGQKLFKELIAKANVVVEDFPPGTLEKLGLSYESLKLVNPELIMASITSFGQHGPYKSFKANELNIAQCGGIGNMLPYFSTDMSRSMVKPGGKAVSSVSGMVVALSTLAATFNQTKNGRGCHIDVSQQDSQLLVEGIGLVSGDCYNLEFSRQKHKPIKRSFREPIKCKDGYFMLCLNTEDREWRRLLKLINAPDLNEEKFLSSLTRHDNWDNKIKPIIEKWASRYEKEELFQICQNAGVSGTPVRTTKELFNNEQMRHRGFFETINHPKTGKLDYPFAPMQYSNISPFTPKGAPLIGEHNTQIYEDLLGYTKKDMTTLRESHTI